MDVTFWNIDRIPHMTRGEARAAVRMAARLAGRSVCYGKDSPSPPAPDPNIGIAARENAELSKEMAAVAREQLAFNREQWNESKPVYQEIINTQLGQMRTDQGRATEQWDLYKNLFQPVEQRMVQDAMTYDSPERKERAAAAAAADVSSSHDAASGVVQRNMQSLGVNPNDPKYVAVMQGAGLSRARDTAGAMNTARTNTELTGMSMRQGTAQFGRNMPATSIAQDAATLNAGNAATGNQNNMVGMRNAGVASATPWYGGAVSGNQSAGSLYNQQYGNQLNAWNMGNQNANAGMAGVGQLAGTALGYWASTGFATKDGGLVRRGRVQGTPGGDGAPLRGAPATIEGEYSAVDEPNIDPEDGEILDAICKHHSAAGLPRRGGVVDGPGSPTSDSIPAQLSDGEAVLNAEAVAMLGEEFITRANEAGLRRRRVRPGNDPAAVNRQYAYEGLPRKRRAIAEAQLSGEA